MAWRIKAGNGQVVATDGGQGYESKTHARATLEKALAAPLGQDRPPGRAPRFLG